MNVVDIIILVLLVLGAISGFRAGVIKKTTDFIGMFVIVIIAFSLKNKLSVIMYENLPFFNFGGFIKGMDAINILLYELVAFLVVFIALLFILKVVVMVTGLFERFLKATVILSIPSKILGIFVGAIEAYVYIFIILVVITLPIFKISFLKESKCADVILHNTPVLSSLSSEMIDIYSNVYVIIDSRKNKTNEEVNDDITKFLISKNIVTKESARGLVEKNKLHITDDNILK